MRHFISAIAAVLLFNHAALAADSANNLNNRPDIVVQAGEFSVLRDRSKEAFMGQLEYRFRDQFYGLRPTIGILGNEDGAFYGYAGINWDLPLGIAPFYITPGVKVGGYSEGHSKDLGYGVEFHDSIEATYRFDNGQRIGAALAHMSNASLGDKNPGTEMITLIYSHPL